MKSVKLIFYALLSGIILFWLVQLFVARTGAYFVLELVGFILLLILSIIGLAGYSTRWGEPVLFTMFILYILNLLLIWAFRDVLYVIPLLLALVGFILALPGKHQKAMEAPKKEEQPPSVVLDEKKQDARVEAVKKSFDPGKYVASKTGAKFHAPNTYWAKKISARNRVWFNSKEEAVKAGYQPGEGVI